LKKSIKKPKITVEKLIILLVFFGALGYLTHKIVRLFKPTQTGCAKGCGQCAATQIATKLPAAE
jgi:hypothetical protein